MTSPEPVPRQAITSAIARLPCVQAGWAFGVPEDGQADWLRMVAQAAYEAAAPHLEWAADMEVSGNLVATATARERERCAQLADQVGAVYVLVNEAGHPYDCKPFAQRLRQGTEGGGT